MKFSSQNPPQVLHLLATNLNSFIHSAQHKCKIVIICSILFYNKKKKSWRSVCPHHENNDKEKIFIIIDNRFPTECSIVKIRRKKEEDKANWRWAPNRHFIIFINIARSNNKKMKTFLSICQCIKKFHLTPSFPKRQEQKKENDLSENNKMEWMFCFPFSNLNLTKLPLLLIHFILNHEGRTTLLKLQISYRQCSVQKSLYGAKKNSRFFFKK